MQNWEKWIVYPIAGVMALGVTAVGIELTTGAFAAFSESAHCWGSAPPVSDAMRECLTDASEKGGFSTWKALTQN